MDRGKGIGIVDVSSGAVVPVEIKRLPRLSKWLKKSCRMEEAT